MTRSTRGTAQRRATASFLVTAMLATLPQAAVAAPLGELPSDLSPWGMFVHADWVVQAVMLGLAFASVVCWTVFVGKALDLHRAARRLRDAREVLARARTLEEATRQASESAAEMLDAAREECTLAGAVRDAAGVKERVALRLERLEAASVARLRRGVGTLATIGASAPFVGLFGTVWGIMDSFIGIARTRTTQLAVVAPGIAEALLATALGLVAAIPAVVLYNVLVRRIAARRGELADIGAFVQVLVSRELDRTATRQAA